MPVKNWSPSEIAAPVGRYSHLSEAPAGSRIVAMAGQVGIRPDGSLPDTVDDQIEVAFENIAALAASAGKGPEDILKLVVFLTERPADGRRFGALLARILPDPPPAMTLIYVAGLFRPEVKVEIDVTLAV
jgi:enamine deaminase RidA (YjgF/YER057c/UK114 family)